MWWLILCVNLTGSCCPDKCWNIILEVSMKVFMEEIGITVGGLWVKQVALYIVGEPHPISRRTGQNKRLAFPEQEGMHSKWPLDFTRRFSGHPWQPIPHACAMWAALRNWFTEYSCISTSTVYLSHAGKAFGWLWPQPWKRNFDFSVEAKPVLFLEYYFFIFSTLFPSKVLWLPLVTHIPTNHPLAILPSLPGTCAQSYLYIWLCRTWFCLSPEKTLNFSELVSPHLLQDWGSVVKLYLLCHHAPGTDPGALPVGPLLFLQQQSQVVAAVTTFHFAVRNGKKLMEMGFESRHSDLRLPNSLHFLNTL